MIIDKLKIVCYNRQKRERKGAAEKQTRWCELCGSCEVVQREGMYVCLFCGMEYTPKEAERLRDMPVTPCVLRLCAGYGSVREDAVPPRKSGKRR